MFWTLSSIIVTSVLIGYSLRPFIEALVDGQKTPPPDNRPVWHILAIDPSPEGASMRMRYFADPGDVEADFKRVFESRLLLIDGVISDSRGSHGRVRAKEVFIKSPTGDVSHYDVDPTFWTLKRRGST